MTTMASKPDMTEPDAPPSVHHDRGTSPGEGKKAFEKMLKGCIKFVASAQYGWNRSREAQFGEGAILVAEGPTCRSKRPRLKRD